MVPSGQLAGSGGGTQIEYSSSVPASSVSGSQPGAQVHDVIFGGAGDAGGGIARPPLPPAPPVAELGPFS